MRSRVGLNRNWENCRLSNALALLGDLHGDPTALIRLDQLLSPAVPIIQVGDFGWYPKLLAQWEAVGASLHRRVYWIRGNHEHYPSMPWLNNATSVEVASNIWFVPDGHVLEIAGHRIGCLGGAASIDYQFRTLGVDWFRDENITEQQAARALAWTDIDLMVTHVPPQCTISESANPLARHQFGVATEWRDHNADVVETVWNAHGCPPLVCGHMHYAHTSAAGVRILGINEAMLWPASIFER